MSNDPNLTDTCFFVQDGPPSEWWTSPDIGILDPGHQTDSMGNYLFVYDAIMPGFTYKWMVSVHRNQRCATVPQGTTIVAELWAADPSLVIAPQNSVKIGSVEDANLPGAGNSHWIAPQPANYWTPSTSSGAPDGPGHKCLVARCYPKGETPDSNDFHCPDDPHVAQHNIFIVQAAPSKHFNFAIKTMPRLASHSHTATLRVTTVVERRVLERIKPRLEGIRGFKHLAAQRPHKLGLALPTAWKGRDASHAPSSSVAHETLVDFGSGRQHEFHLTADLSTATKGEAYPINVTQVGAKGQIEGGLTLVAVVV